jgi:hypothetical protein
MPDLSTFSVKVTKGSFGANDSRRKVGTCLSLQL